MRRTLPILSTFHLPYSLCLIGPPGSGKGTYGRLLSEAWNQTPIYSVSDLLRRQQQNNNNDDDASRTDVKVQNNRNRSIIASNLNTGTLVDCEIVSQIVLSHLQNPHRYMKTTTRSTSLDVQNEHDGETTDSTIQIQQRRQEKKYFIMDGYPRTKRQIDIMIQTWPIEYHITHAIHLDILNSVCESKMLGRRHCLLCQGAPNIANVTTDGFLLPPLVPINCQVNLCRPNQHWIVSRPDDNDKRIVQKRLLEYRQEESALLDYYLYRKSANNNGRSCCIRVTPYHGIDDFPKMQQTIEAWLIQQQQK